MSVFMANEWLKAAQDDLNLICEILNRHHLTNIASFHAQQAVEKSLKAILEYNDIAIHKKHNLITLKLMISEFLEIDPEYDDLFSILNSLYIDSRYPSELGLLPNGKPSIDDVLEFYKFALEIYTKIHYIVNNPGK